MSVPFVMAISLTHTTRTPPKPPGGRPKMDDTEATDQWRSSTMISGVAARPAHIADYVRWSFWTVNFPESRNPFRYGLVLYANGVA